MKKNKNMKMSKEMNGFEFQKIMEKEGFKPSLDFEITDKLAMVEKKVNQTASVYALYTRSEAKEIFGIYLEIKLNSFFLDLFANFCKNSGVVVEMTKDNNGDMCLDTQKNCSSIDDLVKYYNNYLLIIGFIEQWFGSGKVRLDRLFNID